MAKNESLGSPNGSCEKLYKATLSSIKRVSNCSKNNVPSPAKASVSLAKPKAFSHPPSAASEEIPIEFNHRVEVLAKQRDENGRKVRVNVPVQRVIRVSPKVEPHQGNVPVKEVSLKLPERQYTINARVGSYIDRVKNRMRASSNIGGGKSFSRRDSFNDRVSNYINRAKNKLKATSTIKSNEDQD